MICSKSIHRFSWVTVFKHYIWFFGWYYCELF